MVREFPHIKLNGKQYSIDEVKKLCEKQLSDSGIQTWENEIYSFLMDWYSPSDYITVSTSGSTGSPKKIKLQKKHMIASANATLSFFNLKRGDTAWLCLPVKYIAGKMMIVRAIIGGLNLVFSAPDSFPKLNSNQKVSFAAMVPNQVYGLLYSDEGIQQLLQIRKLLIGGSSITAELEEKLLENPAINVWHSYGMTETITHIAMRRISSLNSIGSYNPLPGIKIHTDLENKLVIDAPKIGVSNIITNDVVRILENGSFLIDGRIDNVIISGGIKLFPDIIERKISTYISNNFFVGSVSDEKLGEKLILFIEGDNFNDKMITLLKRAMKQNLQKFEMPRGIIILPEFLRTETGKILRKKIIESYLTRIMM